MYPFKKWFPSISREVSSDLKLTLGHFLFCSFPYWRILSASKSLVLEAKMKMAWGGQVFFLRKKIPSVKLSFLAWDDRNIFWHYGWTKTSCWILWNWCKKEWTWFMFFVTQKPRIRQHRQWRRPVARHEFAGLATVLAPETEKRGVWIDSPKRESVGLADLWFSTQVQHMWACRCWPIFLRTFAQLQTLVCDAGWLPSSSSLRSF